MAIVTFFVAVTSLVTSGVLCVLLSKQRKATRRAVEQIKKSEQEERDVLVKRIEDLPGERAVEKLIRKFVLEYKEPLTDQIETSIAVAGRKMEELVERRLKAQRLETKETVAGVERRIEEVKRAIPKRVEQETSRIVRIANSVRAAGKKLRGKKRAGDTRDEELPESLNPGVT